MTREEAIANLNMISVAFVEPVTREHRKLIDDTFEMAIKELEQEPKTGHWESTELFYEGESRGSIIKCSECGNEFKVSPKVFERLYDNERFCNHCGCRMIEPQESEDKE